MTATALEGTQMLKVGPAWLRKVDRQHPGFADTVAYYERRPVTRCPHCGSGDTATVIIGIVGRTFHLAAATTRVKLLPNGVVGSCYCDRCQTCFDVQKNLTE